MSKLKRVSSKQAHAASRLESELSEADMLIRRKAWAKARELLESIEKRHPNRPKVLSSVDENGRVWRPPREAEELERSLPRFGPAIKFQLFSCKGALQT
jgi:hypothetical protein